MNSGIYSIRHIDSGKVYIGRSTNLYRRQLDHFNKLKKNKHENSYLQNAYNKYGLEAFEYKILEYVLVEFIVEREQWWMDLFGAYTMQYGYNIHPSSTGSYASFKQTEQARLKISKGLTGKKRCPEAVAKHKALMTGRKSPLTKEQWEKIADFHRGKTISDENKAALRLANLGKVHSEETKQRISKSKKGVTTLRHLKYIYTVVTPEGTTYVFNHLRKFAKENGLAHSHLASMINNGTYYKGWTGYKEPINNIKED